MRRVTMARTVMLTAILLWLLVNYGLEVALENAPPLLLFIGLGVAAMILARRHPERHAWPYVFVSLDLLLLAWVLLAPGRTYPDEWPWQAVLRQPSFLYFLMFLALATLTFRPLLVAWTGLCIVLVWTAGTWLIAARTGAIMTMADLPAESDATARLYLERYLDPSYIHIDDVLVRVFVTLVVAAILAYAAYRARRLIYEQAAAARERANLARYVAPSMVDRLATRDRPLAQVRQQQAAVLFADMRGFTALSEQLGPEDTMALLREFHSRMASAVFDHRGTLDKFIGDGLMATFGTPEALPDDTARALACARAMLAAIVGWNEQRREAGMPPVAVRIGLHVGEVTTGDIGGGQRFEFAVIGDTVNVASRLEELARELGQQLVLSEVALTQARAQGAATGDLICLGPQILRGRAAPMGVWVLPAG